MTQYVINIGALPNDGTGDPLRTAFNEVNLNFDQVWATGLVGSNLQIANNTILTTNTNGNLTLAPNGIGKILAGTDLVPNLNNVRNLGSTTRQWNTIYTRYLELAGDLTVGGNLSVTGNIIEVGNIITDAKTIQLANTAADANAANGSGITVGANDNIATFLYDSADNAWVTNVRFETGNLILTDDRIMDLYGPSLTNADLISGATSGLDIVPNGDGNATTLFNTYGNIQLFTSNTGSNVKAFTFVSDGNLIVPGNISINTPAGSNGNINLHPDGNGLVKIQGASPILLNLVGDEPNTLNRIEIDTYGNLNTLGGTFTGTFSRGNLTSPQALQTGDRLAAFKGRGSDGVSLNQPTGMITIDTFANWAPGNTPTQLSFWTTGYGCSAPELKMQLNPDGNLNIFDGNLRVGNGGGFVAGNYLSGNGALYAGVPYYTILGSNVVAQFAGQANSYSQINFQNINPGSQASTDFILTADNGDDSNNFIDMGIASSIWDGTQPNSLGANVEANDGYLYVNGANLVVGTAITDGAVNTWKFDSNGNLTLPGNTSSINYANGAPYGSSLGNLSVDNNNIYNINGQGVVISNFSFIAEAETAYVQIPAGNSPSDLSIVQEQGNVRIAANAAAWSFNTNGIATLPDNTNMGTIEGANTFGFYNNNANTEFLIELGPTNAWSFNGATGNLSVPQNINFNGGGIQQALNEDFYTKVSDNEDEGWSIFNAVDDGAGNTFTLTRLDNSEFIIRTDIPTNNYQWNFDNLGRLVVPGNIMGIYGGNTSFYAYDNGSGGSVELKTISYAGDALGSNIRVTQSNATISTSSGTHTWTFDGAGNLTLPSGGNIVGATANNSGRIQWLGNSSGDGAGYTTLGLIPDDTLTGNDQYLIIDPTAPGHIHIRAGGTQDNSNADLFLGGENTYFKVNAGANSEARISANSHSWVFGQDATLTVPGEGIIRSIQDTVILQSYDIYGNTYSARLGTNGGLYFETTDYPNGWLSLTNNTGNANITAASGTAGAGGKNINITAGSADQGDFYTTPGGSVNITGGLGAFNDGGGGGPGGNVNITAGLSADPAGVAGNVTIGSGTNYWQFLNNGNLYVPGQINGDNNGALVIDGAGYGNGYISLPASSFGGEQIVIVNDFSLGNGIRLQTNGGNLFFGNDGNLTLPGNTFSVNYANGTAVSLGGNYGDSNVASFLAAFGSNTITTTGNITASNFIGAGTNVDIVAGSYDWTFDTTGNLTLPGNSFTVNYANGAQVSLSGSYSNSNVTTLLAAFGSNTISTSGNITAGNLSVAGNVVNDISFTGGNILIDNATGGGGSDEGGELHFATATANSTLSGPIAIDIYQNKMRFFETQGNTFGMFIDIANSMGVAGSSLGVPAIGYRDVPQISLSANVTANVTNAGKHFYSTTAGNITLTIPDNANVAFPTGATLTIVMNAAGNVLVAQGTGVSLYMAGSSTTGNRAVGAYGLASVMKVDTNTWVISGTGVY